jgi:hypothetical protein
MTVEDWHFRSASRRILLTAQQKIGGGRALPQFL